MDKSKNKILKVFSSIIFTCLILLSLFACKSNTSNKNREFPEYGNDEFMLSIWSSPPPTQEAYNECAEAGFNYVLIDQNYGNMSSTIYSQIMNYCANAGMNSILMMLAEEDLTVDSERDAKLCQCEGYAGKFFSDEPSYSKFDQVASYIEDFERDNPNKLFMVNIFPSVASVSALGGSFENYVESYIDKVLNKVSGKKILSCDIYPLMFNARGNYIMDAYLYNLETTAHYTMNTDIDVQYCYQTIGHMSYRNLTSSKDVLFQLNTLMAYGVKSFLAFTYPDQSGSDFWGEALIHKENKNGAWLTTKHDTYYYVQEALQSIKKFQNVYLSFDYKGTMPIIGTLNEDGYNSCFDLLNYPLSNVSGIKSVSATQDTLIGHFNKDGVNAYMITNFTEPSAGMSDKVTIKFDDVQKVQVYINGEYEEREVLDNKIVLSLKNGDGAFVIAV